MTLSPFFADLGLAYDAELDDLATDSAGRDVLASRLRTKRSQLAGLLPMIGCNPEMVAVAFHDGFRFLDPARLGELTNRDADELPAWSALEDGMVELAPWAAELARVVLGHADGDRFLVIAACLEYLQHRPDREADKEERAGRAPREEGAGEEGAGEQAEEDVDLDEAGADWLVEQGFDPRHRSPGE